MVCCLEMKDVKIYIDDGILYVEFHDFYDRADILIYDVKGRLMHEGRAAGLSVYTHDISRYASGPYIIVVLVNGRKYSKVVTLH